MSAPLEISALVPSLALTWFATLVVALVNLAIAEFRGEATRPFRELASDWIVTAGATSIGVVFSELYSRKLISFGTHAFLIAMLFAVVGASGMMDAFTRPACKDTQRSERQQG